MLKRATMLATSLVIGLTVRAAAQAPVRIVIDADLGETTISKYIYGQFGEDLGRNIYDGFWT